MGMVVCILVANKIKEFVQIFIFCSKLKPGGSVRDEGRDSKTKQKAADRKSEM